MLQALVDYFKLCGGGDLDVEDWRVELRLRLNGVSEGKSDPYYFNPQGRGGEKRPSKSLLYIVRAARRFKTLRTRPNTCVFSMID